MEEGIGGKCVVAGAKMMLHKLLAFAAKGNAILACAQRNGRRSFRHGVVPDHKGPCIEMSAGSGRAFPATRHVGKTAAVEILRTVS